MSPPARRAPPARGSSIARAMLLGAGVVLGACASTTVSDEQRCERLLDHLAQVSLADAEATVDEELGEQEALERLADKLDGPDLAHATALVTENYARLRKERLARVRSELQARHSPAVRACVQHLTTSADAESNLKCLESANTVDAIRGCSIAFLVAVE